MALYVGCPIAGHQKHLAVCLNTCPTRRREQCSAFKEASDADKSAAMADQKQKKESKKTKTKSVEPTAIKGKTPKPEDKFLVVHSDLRQEVATKSELPIEGAVEVYQIKETDHAGNTSASTEAKAAKKQRRAKKNGTGRHAGPRPEPKSSVTEPSPQEAKPFVGWATPKRLTPPTEAAETREKGE